MFLSLSLNSHQCLSSPQYLQFQPTSTVYIPAFLVLVVPFSDSKKPDFHLLISNTCEMNPFKWPLRAAAPNLPQPSFCKGA